MNESQHGSQPGGPYQPPPAQPPYGGYPPGSYPPAGGPQNPYGSSPPPRKRHRLRNGLLIGGGVLVVLIVAASLSHPASKPSSHTIGATSHAPVSTSPSASASPADCSSQVIAWSRRAGAADIGNWSKEENALTSAAQPIQDALDGGYLPTQAQISTFVLDDAALSGISFRIKDIDPPPACVPGFRADYINAMNEAISGTNDGLVLVGYLNRDNITGAQAAAILMSQAFDQAASDISSANSDLQQFESGQ